MKILINRTYLKDATTGIAQVITPTEKYNFCTLELPWKNNERRISCIPEGTYEAIPHHSPKFGSCFWLQNVPNRSEILIHPGNYTSQILGCILPGTAHAYLNGDKTIDVVQSKAAMSRLLAYIQKTFEIEIKCESGQPYQLS